jgi:hypothetical protein
MTRPSKGALVTFVLVEGVEPELLNGLKACLWQLTSSPSHYRIVARQS